MNCKALITIWRKVDTSHCITGGWKMNRGIESVSILNNLSLWGLTGPRRILTVIHGVTVRERILGV
jgi:hypothetical protein